LPFAISKPYCATKAKSFQRQITLGNDAATFKDPLDLTKPGKKQPKTSLKSSIHPRPSVILTEPWPPLRSAGFFVCCRQPQEGLRRSKAEFFCFSRR
jgi:hypothetical protein